MAKPDTTLPYLSPQRIRRFWNKVDKRTPEECWPWAGDTNKKNGYGYWHLYIDAKKRLFRVHRVAYFLSYGVDPVGFLVRHRCDNRPCCNPAHLLLGSHQDNMNDMTERHRTATGDRNASRLYPEKLQGERHWGVKLTDDIVRALRAQYPNGSISRAEDKAVAALYGMVSIRPVIRRASWKHVT